MKNNKVIQFLNKVFLLFFYRNDMQLLTAPGKKDRDYFILQSVFGTMVISLFLGVFLTGLYIEMGAPDSVVGYLPILGSIAGIFLVFTGSLTERVKKVKRTVIILNFVGKTLLLSAVFVPLVVSREAAPYIMLPLTFLGLTVNAIMSVIINSWFIDTIDISIRGRYMGARAVFSLLVSATLPVIAGNFLDGFYDRYTAFLIIYLAAWSFSLLESISMGKITEPVPHEGKNKKIKFSELFSVPLKNKEFMKFCAIQMFFHLSWFISMTFASLYEIKYMQLSYSTLTIMGSLSAVIQMFLYPVWGKVIDRHGSAIVMRIAILLYMLHVGIYFFMVKGNAPYLLFLLNINGAILSPAWGLSTFNERFSRIPKEGRTAYDSFFTTLLAIVILLAPTLGNLLRNAIIDSGTKFWVFPEFKLVFILSFVLLLMLNIYLFIQSKKTNNLEAERIFIRAMREKMRFGPKRR